MGTLRIQRPGMLSTVQDLGRVGCSAIGVPRGGAADSLSLRIGNRLLGNTDDGAAIEMTMLGGEFVFNDPATVCLTGGACEHATLPLNTPRELPAGATLSVGPITQGVRAYLCIAGGVRVPRTLGSASTCLGARFGGHHGRALRAGDTIEFGSPGRSPARTLPSGREWPFPRSMPILAVPAPGSSIDPAVQRAFWEGTHTISAQSNRTGVRLSRVGGWSIGHAGTSARMITEGMPEGAVQLPPSLEPIILGPDHPTTGGYPVIACIASIHLHRIGQLRPGDTVRFQRISRADALRDFRDYQRALDVLLPACPAP